MKLTTVFLTGIRLFSDTFYPGALMLHCIQSAWIKTLAYLTLQKYRGKQLHISLNVTFHLKGKKCLKHKLEAQLSFTKVTFVLTHSL